MSRRLIRRIVPVLVAAQLLLSAPVVTAAASILAPADAEIPGADGVQTAAHAAPCPCCPEDAQSEAECLGACLASVGAIASHVFSAARSDSPSPPLPMDVRIVRLSHPPLKPPPIV